MPRPIFIAWLLVTACAVVGMDEGQVTHFLNIGVSPLGETHAFLGPAYDARTDPWVEIEGGHRSEGCDSWDQWL